MSFTKGVSFHHETNSFSQPTITNNISIHASNEVSESTNPYKGLDSSEVKYEPVHEVQSSSSSSIEQETEFLKKVLSIYMSQKLYWQNKFLILSSDELLDLIQTLLPNKGIVITSNDLEDPGCCGFVKDVPIRKVESIWVSDGDAQQNFKYCYSNLVSLLDQYQISIKFVKFL